jgi:lysophospholipase L1-like esterase
MMFGTNDANKDKYTPDWGTDAAKTRYMAAASKMLGDYKKANASVQMFVMTPPSKIRNVTHQKNALLAAQYNREFASANGLTLIDMWAASEAENWVFNDGIHPQGELYASLAEVVYNGVKDTIKK